MNTPVSLRKAAILIDTLDTSSADALLEQFPKHQAAFVRQAVMELDDVAPSERQRVMKEFLARGDAPAAALDGVEIDLALANKLAGARHDQAPEMVYKPAGKAPEETAPFAFLFEASKETVAAFLRSEHPQTVAVVISQLPPGQSAAVLQQFDAELQAEVVQRVAALDEADPEALKTLAQEIHAALAEKLEMERRQQAGRAVAEAILQEIAAEQRTHIMQRLGWIAPTAVEPTEMQNAEAPPDQQVKDEEAVDVELNDVSATALDFGATSDFGIVDEALFAEQIDDGVDEDSHGEVEPLEFADVERLTDLELASVLQAVDAEVALLALLGASEQLANRIYRWLSPQEAWALRRQMENLSPLSLRDVEQAQDYLAATATFLAEQGVIHGPPSLARLAVW